MNLIIKPTNNNLNIIEKSQPSNSPVEFSNECDDLGKNYDVGNAGIGIPN